MHSGRCEVDKAQCSAACVCCEGVMGLRGSSSPGEQSFQMGGRGRRTAAAAVSGNARAKHAQPLHWPLRRWGSMARGETSRRLGQAASKDPSAALDRLVVSRGGRALAAADRQKQKHGSGPW